jgi:mRNA interferase HicA
MKYNEFRRWLQERGVDFKPGKGSHSRLTLDGKISSFPNHGSKEIGKGLL